MPIIDCEQGSPEWLQMRVGCCTSSRLNDALAKLKDPKKESAARLNYRRELAVERLCNRAMEHFVTEAMQHGIEYEPIARAEYELATGQEVQQIGLAMHPTIKWFSASTDGLVGDKGILEIKCLGSLKHLDILLSNEIPEDYHWQMLGGLACTEREWCDFVSYDPRMPEGLQLFIKRFDRNSKLTCGMELEVEQFLKEVERMLETLKAQRAKALAEYAAVTA